ncbi:arylformamidase [Devosia lucknowensis]|uniref:Arylformamidase n=1 Tax=Devosia lucknowensis TaxID=1096929 RepID=A0A1Y6GBF1_9HYPH|nr:alpha/beta hydrolase [Devosia lucknowensis]SMQ85389.1 arylformamidase [Devosia lucknowensis]
MVDLFRTRDHVPEFEDYVAQYAQRSAQTRSRLRADLDVAYGAGADERLDLFFPPRLDGPAPVHLFVHGGYWRMFGKGDFSFVADTVTAAGAIAAVMDYSLMPAVRMETIVAQVKSAARWLVANAGSFGGEGARLSMSGHSAGAHLCATLLADAGAPRPRGCLLLSGVYDIAPLRQSFLDPLIGITAAEAAAFSPLHLPIDTTADIRILVGERETAPFHDQAAALAARLGRPVQTIAGADHMSVALDLGNPDTSVGRALAALCG